MYGYCTAPLWQGSAAGVTIAQHPAALSRERGRGPLPAIVLGGFVPGSTEQVVLLRRFPLRTGDLYYVNYARRGVPAGALVAGRVGDPEPGGGGAAGAARAGGSATRLCYGSVNSAAAGIVRLNIA